jgi:hypothetical protein
VTIYRDSIIAMDPGGLTGFACYVTPVGVGLVQVPCESAFVRLADSAARVYLVEKYRPVRTSDPTAAELNGAARLRSCQLDALFISIQPDEAKSMAPDHVLKGLGWFDPAKPHANDAARLIVHYAMSKADHTSTLHQLVRRVKLAVAL